MPRRRDTWNYSKAFFPRKREWPATCSTHSMPDNTTIVLPQLSHLGSDPETPCTTAHMLSILSSQGICDGSASCRIGSLRSDTEISLRAWNLRDIDVCYHHCTVGYWTHLVIWRGYFTDLLLKKECSQSLLGTDNATAKNIPSCDIALHLTAPPTWGYLIYDHYTLHSTSLKHITYFHLPNNLHLCII